MISQVLTTYIPSDILPKLKEESGQQNCSETKVKERKMDQSFRFRKMSCK